MDYEALMHIALAAAKSSVEEVPVGAVIVNHQGQILAAAHNQKESSKDPTSHAEIEAIRAATSAEGDWRLDNCTLIVTLEPCVMCAGAIVASRLQRVIFGAWDERVGAAGSRYDILRDPSLGRPLEVVTGVLESECKEILERFFESKR